MITQHRWYTLSGLASRVLFTAAKHAEDIRIQMVLYGTYGMVEGLGVTTVVWFLAKQAYQTYKDSKKQQTEQHKEQQIQGGKDA